MLLSDLDELEDVLDFIVPDIFDNDTISEEPFYFDHVEECEIIETLMHLMYDYVDENPTEISEPDFHDEMIENVKELYSPIIIPEIYTCCYNGNNSNSNSNDIRDKIHDDLDELFEIASNIFYTQIIPHRSFPTTFVKPGLNAHAINIKQSKLDYLAAKPQPQQRTEDWYIFRHNLITASNAYKAFEPGSAQNQLIYEKCQPLNTQATDKFSFVNVDSPLHWGQKYEPISVMYYEKEYDTRVGDFGCIQHEQFSFLGASPDGINNDRLRPHRFGRMLEIKNIVNREIDGNPKKEYWIQMQLQMETCDLGECDFLETRFQEYETESDFLNDINVNTNANSSFTTSKKGELKGIIMYFSSSEGKPFYVYKPLDMEELEFEKWSETKMDELCSSKIDENGVKKLGMCWIKNIYWRLDEVSCVLVLRNKKWFNDNIGQLKNTWDIILKERLNGEYVNRAPNKRTKKAIITSVIISVTSKSTIENYFNVSKVEKSGCLLPLKNNATTETNKTNKTTETNEIIKIRTESIDETKQTHF
jgi:putative phage-type endonuclease